MGRKEEMVEVAEGIPEVIYDPNPDHLFVLILILILFFLLIT